MKRKIPTRNGTCKLLYFCGHSVAYPVHLTRDDDQKTVYRTAYQNIIKFIPGLKKFLPVNNGANTEELHGLIESVSCAHTSHVMTTDYCIDAERVQRRPLRSSQTNKSIYS
jgi:hypothetical protein